MSYSIFLFMNFFLFRNFKIANIKITKDELFDNIRNFEISKRSFYISSFNISTPTALYRRGKAGSSDNGSSIAI